MNVKKAAELTTEHYDLKGEWKSLPGEVDYNFLLKADSGERVVVKISRPGTEEQDIEFQAAIMQHLNECGFPLDFPKVVKSKTGEPYEKLGNDQFLRLQTFVPGRMLDDVNPRTDELLIQWGQVCGNFSKALVGFDHAAAHRFYKWNPSETLFSKKYRKYITEPGRVEIADHFWGLFEQVAKPKLPELRKSVNYNDAHEHNLLVNLDLQKPEITGVIDFGDVLYSEVVNEVAIACAYAGMKLPDPISAMQKVVKGYHGIFPLTETELEVLFPLIGARLMITVASAAYNKHREPDNEYLVISEKPAWELLKKLREISPNYALYAFRKACGFTPVPQQNSFQNWLLKNKKSFAPVIDLTNRKIINLDLSVGSLELGNNSNFENITSFDRTIRRLLEDKEADGGQGGYGEVRPFYSTDAYKVEGNHGAQWRTVHLGHDVWMPAGTEVMAPLDGKIHSFQNNANERDYGPAIVLEHEVDEDLIFYTLYGHLSEESLNGLSVGMEVKKGQTIATLGAPPVNGNWPSHLHFQVILDMLGIKGDFSGASFPEEQEVWLSICPDPTSFFEGATSSLKRDGKAEILDSRSKNLGKSLSISYSKPLHMVRGYKQFLYDTSGRRYLDTVNNVPHVGHQHPRVVSASKAQTSLLNTNTRYLHENIVRFAEELLETFPPELEVVHFVNSGSEANELALRMAKTYSGQQDMIAVEVGYHGNTGACIDISSYKFDGKGGSGAPEYTQIVPIPDTYRGLYRNDPEAGNKYAEHIQKALETIEEKGRGIAGFICEGIISCGGQIVLPENYLKEAYKTVRAAGGVCISDEVQEGFGRVGEHFWAFELQGVVPDIVTMGKPIGNGHPLAAVVTTRAVADAFANGMEYFNTFGGNPVSCAIGREVLAVIRDEKLQENAQEVGNYLKSGLNRLKEKFPIIGDVRGHGLFLGFELVKDRNTLEPAAEQAGYLSNRMRQRSILMSTDGPYYNVLKIKPPMCFSKKDADFLLENLELVLAEDFLKIG
ncbi:MAG: aminotransferase class III-fold pyridoxal phosphate-dependent enzyme [Bacteroidetes bacterium]|nr:MAG: aminotransferase class III-fold pyridoxal phosphate-dependent enzyme [Bacteroidota bacterium]